MGLCPYFRVTLSRFMWSAEGQMPQTKKDQAFAWSKLLFLTSVST
jgi:hypothetical protein